ncbi:hypothetical protein OZX72_02770 [Bifidobacterium sp. ESL0769]|nr:hypothetical protein [Bifidobacterium sp. ESL0769]WEV67924.1 hypothetical protein OZX72_02770 [Bifidobacterium sp. ESL0769]
MSNSLNDDSQELRGVTADGTPLGVQAWLSLSFDETLSEDVATGTEMWQQVLQAIAGGKVRADVTVRLENADGLANSDDADIDSRSVDGEEPVGNAINSIMFTNVPITIGTGQTASETGVGKLGAAQSAAPTKASLAGATIAEQQRRDEADKKQAQQQDIADDVYTVPRRAIIAMRSKTTDAAKRFRSAIVSLDAVPGNQVEGISPLYHVMGIDSSDASAAVIQLTTKLKPQAIVALLDSLSASHEGAVTLRLVDVEGETMSPQDTTQRAEGGISQAAVGNGNDDATGQSANTFSFDAADNVNSTGSVSENAAQDIAYAIELPLAEAKKQAEILAPWLDMDPDARLDGDPVSFLLAMAPDAARVGKVDDRWILGETQ